MNIDVVTREQSGSPALYERFKIAVQTFTGGAKVNEAETHFLETLQPEVLEVLKNQWQREQEFKLAEEERQKISPAEITHDRKAILLVVEGVKELAGTERFVHQGNFQVEGTPEGVSIHGYSTKFNKEKGGHYSLLAVNGENIVVGFYDFNIGKWPDGRYSASGKALVDVEARNKGLGGALKRSMEAVCQSEANRHDITIVAEAANQNASLGRFQEQKRWQRLFLKRDIFKPKVDGLILDVGGDITKEKQAINIMFEQTQKAYAGKK